VQPRKVLARRQPTTVWPALLPPLVNAQNPLGRGHRAESGRSFPLPSFPPIWAPMSTDCRHGHFSPLIAIKAELWALNLLVTMVASRQCPHWFFARSHAPRLDRNPTHQALVLPVGRLVGRWLACPRPVRGSGTLVPGHDRDVAWCSIRNCRPWPAAMCATVSVPIFARQ